ncbi:hypothetical protein [Nonomuraea guangzhouensis]|uniref:Uncharacterized protein n=1 Tax=Nonomuraea guangzhouensis TaxID=1291555 RepID=A0ABW4GN55_9ACTN|nr:hypothetical protein [Nonomuraea guangzhouensis]
MDTPPLIEELAQLIGVNVLDVDPDKVVTDARAVSDTVPNLTTLSENADSTMERATDGYQGQSATALAENWQRNGGGLHQTAAAMNVLPPVTNGFASVASAARLAEITQLVDLASVLKLTLGAGAAGAGLAASRMAFSRAAIQRIKHTFERGVATRLTPAVERITRRLEELGGKAVGPRGGPALAGPGGRLSPYENPIRDRGLRTNMAWGRKDNTGKFHGDVPNTTTGMTEREKRRIKKDLEDSIKTREEEDAWLGGSDAGHAERMRREREALKRINEDLNEW